MNRPRRNDRRHWPDYLISRTKPGGKYYSWKHPHTGKEYGLGYSFQDAAAQAREANLALLSERSQKATLLDRITGSDDETMDAWLDRFASILDKRPGRKKGAEGRSDNTKRIDKRMLFVMREHFAGMLVSKVTTKDCDDLLQKYRDAGHDRATVNVRAYMVDCFNEAESAGWIPRGTNPAEIIKANAPKTKRNRLSLEHFKKVLDHTDGWKRTAILLALITGQRVSDVAAMRYDAIKGGFLWVQQIKTGDRIKIPIGLELLGYSLEKVIKESRQIVGAKTIVHQTEKTARSAPGDAICKESISRAFTDSVREHLPKFTKGKPPTFHEIRALSKALHTERGIDTLMLLGHDDEKTAKIYTDPREGWVEVKIPKTA